MFEDLYKNNCYDNNLNEIKKTNINVNSKYFGTDNNQKNDNFGYICNCTFNNYLKNIN